MLITDDVYVNIQGWMRTRLGLYGNNLLVFSIIYGFCQDQKTEFNGSIQYLADWCGATRQGILKNLKYLIDQNLIIQHKINEKHSTFTINFENVNKVNQNNVNIVTENVNKVTDNVNTVTENVNKVNEKCKQSLPNNIVNNIVDKQVDTIVDNKAQNSKSKRTPKQEKNLEKICLKLQEYEFSENIEELILRFYSDKIECGQFIPDNQLEAQLTRLAQESEDQQLIAINRAIEGGWKNITAYFNNDFNKPEVPGYHIHRDGDQNHWQHPQHNGAKEKAEKYGVKF